MSAILGRELLELLRTRRALAFQLGLALACALLVLVRWPTEGAGDLAGARSLQVLRVFGYGLLAGVLLLVPAYPAVSFVREKVKGTLALLLNSPLSAWSVYAGKLGAVLGFTALLLLMTVPAAAACHALGGSTVQWGVGLLYSVLALAAVQLATLALLVSSRAQSTDGALRATYAWVLAVCVLTLIPHWLLQGDVGPHADLARWLQSLSPVPAVLEVLGQRDLGTRGMGAAGGAAGRYALLASLMSVACALATVLRLNHELLDRSRRPGVMTEDRPGAERAARRVLYLVDPQRRSGSTSLLVNPVMVKEFRSRRFGRSHWILRLIAVSAILSLGLSYVAASGALGWGIEEIGGALVLLQVGLLILFAPSLGAGLISAERESGTWQLLRMTPLSPGVILRGKLMSVAFPMLLLLCATLPGYVVMMTVEPTLAVRVQRVLACLGLTAAFVVLVSAAASSLFRSTAAATAAAYLVLLGICLGPLLMWLARDAPFSHAAVEAVLTMSPVAAALQASDAPGFSRYELFAANAWLTAAASLALLVFLGVRVWQLYRPE